MYPTLQALYTDFLEPAHRTLRAVEARGIYFDFDAHALARRKATDCLLETRQRWADLSSGVNPGSPLQVKKYFYETLKYPIPPICGSLKAIRATQEGKQPTDQAAVDWLLRRPDTDKDLLEAYRDVKQVQTLSQFVTMLPDYVHNHRLYTSFGTDTATNRLASRNPNMQNIPANDPFGIRKCFAAPEGYRLAVADFSALELYIMAHWVIKWTGDTKLYEDLLSGDVYSSVATNIWPRELRGIEPATIKSHPDLGIRNLRAHAKAIVLGTNYGKSAGGLAIQLGVSEDEAKQRIDDYFRAYQGIAAFREMAIQELRDTGRVQTITGRYRDLPEINSPYKRERNKADRQAVNTKIQGSAADVVLQSMVNLEEMLKCCPQILQVHDEILLEVPGDAPESDVKSDIARLMENVGLDLRVELKVEPKIVSNWSEGK